LLEPWRQRNQPRVQTTRRKRSRWRSRRAPSSVSHFCACLLCADHRLAPFRVAAAGDGVQGGTVWEVRGQCDAATPGLQSESFSPSYLAHCVTDALRADSLPRVSRSVLTRSTTISLFLVWSLAHADTTALPSCSRFKDGELNVGENSCIDRCTAKYWQASVGLGFGGLHFHALTPSHAPSGDWDRGTDAWGRSATAAIIPAP
jgi:Tim10/DDP family zinc finger